MSAGKAIEVSEPGGFAGPAKCFKLDPPLQGNEYVTIWTQDAYGASSPEVVVVAAKDETGAAKNLVRLVGSYVGETPTHSGALFLAGYLVS